MKRPKVYEVQRMSDRMLVNSLRREMNYLLTLDCQGSLFQDRILIERRLAELINEVAIRGGAQLELVQ